ncbi:MAG: AsnC family transcriptional regulator [Asgard group archaeon]|nr:AsnC family transcriptional regulator [Asgard group archaeon]
MIDAKDMEILLYLQNDPLAKLSQIAEFIGMSVSNISARIERLEKEYKLFHGVNIDLKNSLLGLEIFDFFYEVKNTKALKTLEEKFCYYHPYIIYRARCNGFKNGLYLQFRAPNNGLNYIEELSGILVNKGIIDNFQLIKRKPNIEPIRISSSLSSWNQEKGYWVFDWDNWQKQFQNASDNIPIITNQEKSILNELTELDIKLLAELTINARRKNVDIMKKIGLKPEEGNAQRVSRRIRFLKENIIKYYRINLQWTLFHLYQSIIIRGYCNDKLAYKIYNYINNNISNKELRFPFRSNYFLTDDGFFWYIRAPPAHLSEFNNFIWNVCPNYELYNIDYKYTEFYGLWDKTFDTEKVNWKISYDFMIDNIVKHL